jgi:hypothetical protein
MYVIPSLSAAEARNLISREEVMLQKEIPRREAPRNDKTGEDRTVVTTGLIVKVP